MPWIRLVSQTWQFSIHWTLRTRSSIKKLYERHVKMAGLNSNTLIHSVYTVFVSLNFSFGWMIDRSVPHSTYYLYANPTVSLWCDLLDFCIFLLRTFYFLITSGPVLSPVSLLCFTCEPSHFGNVFERQQRQYATTPLSLAVTVSSMSFKGHIVATFAWSFWMLKLTCPEALLPPNTRARRAPMPIPIAMLTGSRDSRMSMVFVVVRFDGSGWKLEELWILSMY